ALGGESGDEERRADVGCAQLLEQPRDAHARPVGLMAHRRGGGGVLAVDLEHRRLGVDVKGDDTGAPAAVGPREPRRCHTATGSRRSSWQEQCTPPPARANWSYSIAVTSKPSASSWALTVVLWAIERIRPPPRLTRLPPSLTQSRY